MRCARAFQPALDDDFARCGFRCYFQRADTFLDDGVSGKHEASRCRHADFRFSRSFAAAAQPPIINNIID